MAGPADGHGALHAPEGPEVASVDCRHQGVDCCAVLCLTHETLLSRLSCGPNDCGRKDVDRLGVLGHPIEKVDQDRKSTRLNSSHGYISYAVFCLKKKTSK